MKNTSTFGTIESREVAEMVGKTHGNLMRDIETYVGYMTESNEIKIDSVDFFVPSAYEDAKGEARKCYLITKKGCEMIANKLTGAKGIQFTAAYVTRFNDLEQAQNVISAGANDKLIRARAMLMNAQTRQYNAIMKTITDKTKLSTIAVEVFGLKALEQTTGVSVGNLLPECEKTYSATEVGKMFGVTAARIGRLANQNNIKTEEYGKFVMDKSPYSAKEVEAFRYNSRAVDAIGKLLAQ